ncbi:MAG: adenylate/guanylate cyclase domain-containing protein [Betaproteobacteria bacterium]|nr:adenylate/guanylate cyclase domain-containing protein [Betaproteobacteria bacterium]
MWHRSLTYALGERPRTSPPERVRALIDEQQVQSEILIGWVQFALVAFFLVLYVLAPKTSAGTRFLPVPWVLGAFLVATCVRLVFAHRRMLGPVLLLAGVCIDMAMLMGLIWSFHLQYEQPAPFYLKAPTMLYVFIFIALRSLRFEPLYVIAAGIAAAGGWLTLLAYAALSEETKVTRDYVQYMTSNTVLIGAEIDKVISILMVTVVLALGLVRARRVLYRAVADSVLAHDLQRFVAPEVAERITRSERELRPGDAEVRMASILFTDIEGFSTISEKLRPEALVALLNEYFAALTEVIDRHGGVITQFRGDAMLITFNTVRGDRDHAANAVRTALAIQELTRDRAYGEGIAMRTRCGINTGEVVSGAVGAKDRLLYTVHGDEVNVAARLEQLNKSYGTYVLAAEGTVRAASHAFSFERAGEVIVRGRSAPTTVYTPARVAETASSRPF